MEVDRDGRLTTTEKIKGQSIVNDRNRREKMAGRGRASEALKIFEFYCK